MYLKSSYFCRYHPVWSHPLTLDYSSVLLTGRHTSALDLTGYSVSTLPSEWSVTMEVRSCHSRADPGKEKVITLDYTIGYDEHGAPSSTSLTQFSDLTSYVSHYSPSWSPIQSTLTSCPSSNTQEEQRLLIQSFPEMFFPKIITLWFTLLPGTLR